MKVSGSILLCWQAFFLSREYVLLIYELFSLRQKLTNQVLWIQMANGIDMGLQRNLGPLVIYSSFETYLYFCQYTLASPEDCKMWWGKMPQWLRMNLVARRCALWWALEQGFRCLKAVICCQFWCPGLQLLMQRSTGFLWVLCHHWLPSGLVQDIIESLHTWMRHLKSLPLCDLSNYCKSHREIIV